MKIRLTLTGRRYDLADAIPSEWELPDDSSVAEFLDRIAQSLPADGQLPATCMIAVAGTHLGTVASHTDRTLRDGDEMVLVTPVAGG